MDRTRITIKSGTMTLPTTAASATGTRVEVDLTNALTSNLVTLNVALAADAVGDNAGIGIQAVAATSVVNALMAVPATVSATATAGDRQVTLQWATPHDNGSAILRYQVQQHHLSMGSFVSGPWTNIQGSNANTVTHTVTDLTNGVTYAFDVRAVNSIGPGGSSTTQSVIPGTIPSAPRILTAQAGDRHVRLQWVAPASNGGNVITGYPAESGNRVVRRVDQHRGQRRRHDRAHGHRSDQRDDVHLHGASEEPDGQRPAVQPGERHAGDARERPAELHGDRGQRRGGTAMGGAGVRRRQRPSQVRVPGTRRRQQQLEPELESHTRRECEHHRVHGAGPHQRYRLHLRGAGGDRHRQGHSRIADRDADGGGARRTTLADRARQGPGGQADMESAGLRRRQPDPATSVPAKQGPKPMATGRTSWTAPRARPTQPATP